MNCKFLITVGPTIKYFLYIIIIHMLADFEMADITCSILVWGTVPP